MLTYKAMYKYLDEGVHGEVLDFPGAITCGADLEETRRLLASALVDMAETNLLHGEPLPQPDPNCTDPDADLEEPIVLEESVMKEYSLVIDGVIEMVNDIDEKMFFDGLLDTIIEYVERYNAFAGLSMSHKEYEYVDEDDAEETHGAEAA